MEEYTCTICLELLCHPATLICQHSFCINCISNVNVNAKIVCPLCRCTSYVSKLSKNILLHKILLEKFGDVYKQRCNNVEKSRIITIVKNSYINSTRSKNVVTAINDVCIMMKNDQPVMTIDTLAELVQKRYQLLSNKYANFGREIHNILYKSKDLLWNFNNGFIYCTEDTVYWDNIVNDKQKILLQLMWAMEVECDDDVTIDTRY